MEIGLPEQERVYGLEYALPVPADEGDVDSFRAGDGGVVRREGNRCPDDGGDRKWPVDLCARVMVASNLSESKARVGEMGRNSKGGRGAGEKLSENTKLYNLTSGSEVVQPTRVVEDTEVVNRGGRGDFKYKKNFLKLKGVIIVFKKGTDFWGPKLGGSSVAQDGEAFSRKEVLIETHKIFARRVN